MAIGTNTSIPPAHDPENEAPKAKVLQMPVKDAPLPNNICFQDDEPGSEVREVSTLQDFAAKKAEEAIARVDEDDSGLAADEYDFVLTPEVKAELAAGGHDLEYGEYGDNEDDLPVIDEDLRYLPGVDIHPDDKAPEISVIGAGRRSTGNMTARAEQIEYARQKGYSRILQIVLNFHHDGIIETEESDIDVDSKQKQAAQFLIDSLNEYQKNGIDPSDEYLFQLVTEALLNVLGPSWKLHLTDNIVDTVSRILVDEDTTAEDLVNSIKLIALSREEWQFEALQKFAEFAEDNGNERRRKGEKTDLSASKFVKSAEKFHSDGEELELPFPIFAMVLDECNSWKEGAFVIAILRKPAEELKTKGSFRSIELNGTKKRLIMTLKELDQLNNQAYQKALVDCSKKSTLQEAGRLAARRLAKYRK